MVNKTPAGRHGAESTSPHRLAQRQQNPRLADALQKDRLVEPRSPISLVFTFWLVFVWVAVFGSFTPLSVLGAIIVSLAVQWVLPLPRRPRYFWFRPLQVLYLIGYFLWDLLRAGVHVSLLVLFPRPRVDAIIRCPVKSDVPEYLTILAAMTSMIPGTIVVRIDRRRHFMYLHSLDIEKQGGVEGVRAATAAQEERILRAVAPQRILRKLHVSAWSKSAGPAPAAAESERTPNDGLVQLEVDDG